MGNGPRRSALKGKFQRKNLIEAGIGKNDT
jgi:hypothetical protein